MTSREQPNVLFIVCDELTASVLSSYGGTQVDTPAIDELAAESAVFDSAYCNAPVCTPSRYSMLTGRYPWDIDVYHNQSPVPSDVPNMAMMLGDRGYESVAIGKMHFRGENQMWGYERRPYGDFGGLSHQPDPIVSAPRLSFVTDAGPSDIPENKMQDVIVGWLAKDFLRERDTARPFFLHLSFNFPHYPLRPPERLFDKYYPERADMPAIAKAPEQEHAWMQERRAHHDIGGERDFTEEQIRRARAAYYACTELVDEQIGKVLDTLKGQGLADRTVVVLAADHGEMLGEYGTWEKNCFYEPSVGVPLFVRIPGVTNHGSRVSEVVELVDVLPTVEQLTRGSSDAGSAMTDTDGESLMPLITRSGSREKDYAISMLAPTFVEGVARMVRRGPWKYVEYDSGPPSLFNLESDPDELIDLGLQDGPLDLPDKRLASLAAVDFERVQRRSRSPELAVHPLYSDMSPNQFRSEDGTLADAEDFYGEIRWERPTLSEVPGLVRVRPKPPQV